MLVDRRLLVLPAVALVVAAVVGYAAGRGHTRASHREATHTASLGTVLLELPERWHQVAAAPSIPGLAIGREVALAPGGDASSAGLLAGVLPAGQAGPLPRAFVARMRQPPATAIVSLQETQAYRYSAITIPGLAQSLTVYVVPNPDGNPTALVCYGVPGRSAEIHDCQRAVATLTLAGQEHSYDITPQPEYAQRLSTLVASLDGKRVSLRGQLSGHVPPATAQRLANSLAGAFAEAAATLEGLETTLATSPAQSALSGAFLKARDAYAALAAAAAQRSEARFAATRAGVEAAEAGVDAALENFALLGYKRA
jgi:hypothetical protein